ncbi:Fidgetin-like protein 1 [Cichlidogyrus casuarinus]|uniref:Fidgetin-like protein 1 n=1 Tax=Cichlidogyrus casuarinus TaxID=1844966 RepID=A0ABD2QFH1_9PLAT
MNLLTNKQIKTDFPCLEEVLSSFEEIELTFISPQTVQNEIQLPTLKMQCSTAIDKSPLKQQEEVPKQKEKGLKFQTAGQLLNDNTHKQGDATQMRSLGSRSVKSNFVSPFSDSSKEATNCDPEEQVDERLKGYDKKILETIMSEIMDCKSEIKWDDIAGLEFVKKTLKEIIILPMLRPDLFTGLRGPPKGLLLFGPPGTGKTLIGKCVAAQSNSTFFSISASSLTSKWVGEGEKMVRALFAVAKIRAPAVIFIDEIDSLLTQRSETEHESSRRIKTEFLVQLDGVNVIASKEQERILLIGATNRPHELDEAARRRFVKRLYIPLPCRQARRQIVVDLLQQQLHAITDDQIDSIADQTDGFSGADMANLCREAAMGPIRTISFEDIKSIKGTDVRPINVSDFDEALQFVRPSVSPRDLDQYLKWNKEFGSFQYH